VERRIYLTTPIYYINARPHIGHAYTTIVCDVIRRFYKLLGYETYFLTGTDEHGDKIMRAARAAGCEPQAYADEISAIFRNLWPTLHISPDDFIRTTEERHKKVVRAILQNLHDKGEIYHAHYGGFYCTGCERFYTDKELVNGKCPDHLTEPEWIEEENYFFRMSAHQDWLVNYINAHPDFIRPERYRKEVLSFLNEPLKDLCISRPRSRLPWGITLPFDDNYVTYVWFDALVNYISAPAYPDGEIFKKFWQVANHFIAKDILKPHAIYWPCMLHGAGIPPYQRLNVHGWWSLEKHKISKSLGNVVEPLSLAEKYGADAFRYFLLREMAFGLDADFSEENIRHRFNSDLANDFGNLINRITTMIQKYCGSVIPVEGNLNNSDHALLNALEEAKGVLPEYMENLRLNDYIERIMIVCRLTNKYINDQAPWALAEKKETERLQTILNTAARVTCGCAKLLLPVMPEKCAEALANFGITEQAAATLDSGFAAERHVQAGKSLFPRVIQEPSIPVKEEHKETVMKNKPTPPTPESPFIEYEDFAKMQLKTAHIIAAERIPNADKLLRMEIDMGTEKRQIVAGIATDYKPEDVIGKTIIVVANLKPRKIRGIESNGMLLAAHGEKGLSLVIVDRPVEPGKPVT